MSRRHCERCHARMYRMSDPDQTWMYATTPDGISKYYPEPEDATVCRYCRLKERTKRTRES